MVVAKHSAEPIAACDHPRLSFVRLAWVNQLIIEPLMIALLVIVNDKISKGTVQRLLAEEYHPPKALGLWSYRSILGRDRAPIGLLTRNRSQ